MRTGLSSREQRWLGDRITAYLLKLQKETGALPPLHLRLDKRVAGSSGHAANPPRTLLQKQLAKICRATPHELQLVVHCLFAADPL